LRFPAELLGWLRLVRLRWAERLSRPRLAGALRAVVLGRTWIALVAFALIGIVTLQLGLLKLNASIGRGLEHEALLQRQNAELSIENSEMDASASIQSRAERLGMELVPPGLLRFLSARPAGTNSAAAVLNAPIGSSASGSPEAPASAPQGQSGASPASAGTSPAGTEAASTPTATSPSPTGSQAAPASEPGASSTASSPPATTTAPEAARATPREPAAAPSPAGGSSAGAPAAGGSGEAPSGGGTQTASPGG
jgi:hypothetical protein